MLLIVAFALHPVLECVEVLQVQCKIIGCTVMNSLSASRCHGLLYISHPCHATYSFSVGSIYVFYPIAVYTS